MENATATNLPFTCPLDVQFLLHCHMTPQAYEPWSEPVSECAGRMLLLGLIESGDFAHGGIRSYRTTPLGNALVEAVLLTKIPRVVYVTDHGTVLNAKP